jgi:transcriptional regulator with XRE-family HTH domain
MNLMADTHPIRDYRTRNDLTQGQLGERIGVTAATISRWEQRLREPRGDDLQRLCSATGIPVAEILGTVEGQAAAE